MEDNTYVLLWRTAPMEDNTYVLLWTTAPMEDNTYALWFMDIILFLIITSLIKGIYTCIFCMNFTPKLIGAIVTVFGWVLDLQS
jgi:hypothetical protein